MSFCKDYDSFAQDDQYEVLEKMNKDFTYVNYAFNGL